MDGYLDWLKEIKVFLVYCILEYRYEYCEIE